MSEFIEIAENPTPRGAVVDTFAVRGDATMRVAFFPAETPRGTIIVEPGWAEFIEKYFEVVDDLRKRNLNVAMMDWRGQGLSPAPQSWSGYFDLLAEDLKTFRERAVAERFGGPYYLLTHSMGGLPALLLLASGYDGFSRAILSAPMTRLFPGAMNAIYGAVATTFCLAGAANTKVFRNLDDSRSFEGNQFTKDPVRHERFRLLQEARPDVALFAPTYGWLRDAIAATSRIHRPGFFDKLKTPVKIISAGAEAVSDGSDHAGIAAMSPAIEHEVIDGALHEILMEADVYRNVFWAHLDTYLSRD